MYSDCDKFFKSMESIFPDASTTITSYINNVTTMNKSTAYHYHSRLRNFKDFIADEYGSRLSVDCLVLEMKEGEQDPYNVLNSYAAYLKNRNISALTLKQRIVTR